MSTAIIHVLTAFLLLTKTRPPIPSARLLSFPTITRLPIPSARLLSFPTITRPPIPSARLLSFPTITRLPIPTARLPSFPTITRLPIPSARLPSFPTITRLPIPSTRLPSFPTQTRLPIPSDLLPSLLTLSCYFDFVDMPKRTYKAISGGDRSDSTPPPSLSPRPTFATPERVPVMPPMLSPQAGPSRRRTPSPVAAPSRRRTPSPVAGPSRRRAPSPVAGPSSELDTSSTDNDQATPAREGRTRSKRPRQATWQKNRAKAGRLSGAPFVNRSGVNRPGASDKPFHPCPSRVCINQCATISGDERKYIRGVFWNLKSWEERRNAVCCLVHKKRGRGEKSMNSYTLKLTDRTVVPVCRSFFCNTLSLPTRTVNQFIIQRPVQGPNKSKAAKTGKFRKLTIDEMSFLSNWLRNLSTVPSHYCRKSPTYAEKKFLEPGTTIADLHREYQKQAQTEGVRAVAITKFTEAFHQEKLSVFVPRKDQCDLCVGHDVGNVTAETFEAHRARIKRSKKEKKRDERAARRDPTMAVLTMDLQGVLLCPRTNASAMYYRTKLIVHNYTYFEQRTKKAYCYFWNETDGDVSGQVFASLHRRHIIAKLLDKNPALQRVILWSDGCNAQTRNKDVASMFIHLAMERGITVEQKYFVPGHSQMECDSMHSKIEMRAKKASIFVPRDYVKLAKKARTNPMPYRTKQLQYTDFVKLSRRYVDSIRPGRQLGDSKVVDCCAYRYAADPATRRPTVSYKLNFIDEWRPVPQDIVAEDVMRTLEPLYDAPLPITARKYNDLQELKAVMPVVR